jgi:hypothetical protein
MIDNYLNLEIKSIDLDRADASNLKPMITNFFKYCFASNNFKINAPVKLLN